MTKMRQNDAVVLAVTNVFNEHNISFEEGMDARTLITDEIKAQVRDILVIGFQQEKIELSREPYETESKLKSYVNGLINNHLTKDKRLNGGVKHEIKNPGSRAGSGDDQLKALKALLSTKSDPTERSEIQKFIDLRMNELQVSKAKQVVIDYNSLPEALRKKFQA